MIYVCGDTHIPLDIGKLSMKNFSEQAKMTRNDFVIILGDFGLLWRKDKTFFHWLKWLEEKPFTLLWLDGNHENHPRLAEFPEEIWHKGRTHRISESVYHLTRGQVFEIEGYTFFTMGGAHSTDIMYRRPGVSWWPEELPSEEEYSEAIRSLDTHNWHVDYVLTHDLPTKQLLELAPYYEPYALTDWLNGIRKRLEYKHWFCGHHHVDKDLSDNIHILYDQVIPLEQFLN